MLLGACAIAAVLAAVVVPSAGRGQAVCIGDCTGDGAVSVDDLIVGIEALLDGAAPAECTAWDPDGDGQVRIDDLVRGVALALAGPCRVSASPTSTPTVPADPLLALIQPVWEQACTPLGHPLLGYSRAGPEGLAFYCMAGPGHDNRTTVRRYANANHAALAFADASTGFQPTSLRDLPAAYDEQPFVPGGPITGGTYRTLVWQLGCWVATVASFDDTSYRFAPDPTAFSEAILDVAREALLARCPSVPTPTPTTSATVTPPADPLLAAIRAPWESACRPPPVNIGSYAYEYQVDHGYGLACERSAGHGNTTELRRYPSALEAADAFASASVGFDPLALEGVPAASRATPFPPGSASLDGQQILVLWQMECWVARVRSYDDTHFRIAPDPVALSRAILASASDLLRVDCVGTASGSE